MKPEDLITTIQECFADSFESIVLYGSAASGHFQPKHSNYNLLILTKKTSESNPMAGQKPLKRWLRNNPPPLIWDLEFFKSSIDVFPLEFQELKAHHKILWGKPLPSFEVDLKNLRHQLEMELRSKYLQLKNHPAHLLNHPKLLIKVLLQSIPSIFTLIKGVLYLLKKTPEQDRQKRVEQLGMLVDIHPDVFENLLKIREGKIQTPRKEEIPEIFEAYLTELRTIIRFVNQLEGHL